MLIIKHQANRDICYRINRWEMTDRGLEVYDHQIYNISGKTSFPMYLKFELPDFTISKDKLENWLMMSMKNVNQDFKKNEWEPLNVRI